MRSHLAVILAFSSVVGCSQHPPKRFEPHQITLASGAQVRVVDHRTSDYTLFIRYETHIPLSNVPALQSEAFEVFRVFQSEADADGLDFARITPQNGSRTLGFLLSRRVGPWEFQELPSQPSG